MSKDRRRLEDLYEACAPQALGYLVRMVGDRAWAEDVLQESFLRLAKRAPEIDDDAALRAYLYRTATHLAIDGIRSRRRGTVALDAARKAAVDDPRREGSDPAP